MISSKRVTLLVSGSIAAYKVCELVREFQSRGAVVRVALSKAAQEFVSPLTLQTLSKNPVAIDLFDLTQEREIGHISLADQADIIVCAPATADLLAKAAYGHADDLLSTVLLAARCPIVFVPAMNVNMWENPITQKNVCLLREAGAFVLEPDTGELACGWIGQGRMPDLEYIIDAASYCLSSKELEGTRVIVTAGPTREAIDPIRFVSNKSSGKMGYAIARVCRWLGAEVTLITGPTSLTPPPGVCVVKIESAEEMRKAVFSAAKGKGTSDIRLQTIFMASAVSDHRPTQIHEKKLKMNKSEAYDVSFEPTIDILATLGAERDAIEKESGIRLSLVGFAAETGDVEELLTSAREKQKNKNVDMVVANFATESLGNDQTRLWLITDGGKELEIGVNSKQQLAIRIVRTSLKI